MHAQSLTLKVGHDNPLLWCANIRHMTNQLIPLAPTHALPPALPSGMADEVTRLRTAGKSANTRRAWSSDWSAFSTWCKLYGFISLPAHADTVSAYLGDQATRLSVATLRRHVSTISKAHQVAGLPNPCKSAEVSDTLAGLRRLHGKPQGEAKGLLVEAMRATLDTLSTLGGNPVLALSRHRDRALLLVGWAGALRRSELAGLTWADIEHDPDGLVIMLRKSKTDQVGQGRRVGVARHDDPDKCPVMALAKWREVLQRYGGADACAPGAPVLRQINKHGHILGAMSGQAVAFVIQRRTAQAGLGHYQGHSLRKGLVQSARLAGVSDSAVMATTGHKSVTMLRRYQGQVGLVANSASRGLL